MEETDQSQPKETEQQSEESQKTEEQKQEEKVEKELEVSIEYDELQQLYIDIQKDLTYDHLIDLLQNSNLYYSEFDGRTKVIKIAFDEKATPFRYAESGDHVKVHFNKDLQFDSATYFNQDKLLTLLYYENGTYWELHDQPEYAGYYISDFDSDETMTIKYANGNEVEADLIKVNSKEEQFQYLHNKEE